MSKNTYKNMRHQELLAEQCEAVLNEGWLDRMGAKAAGLGAGVKAAGRNIGRAAKNFGKTLVGGKLEEPTEGYHSAARKGQTTAMKNYVAKKAKNLQMKLQRQVLRLNAEILNDMKKLGYNINQEEAEKQLNALTKNIIDPLGTEIYKIMQNSLIGSKDYGTKGAAESLKVNRPQRDMDPTLPPLPKGFGKE